MPCTTEVIQLAGFNVFVERHGCDSACETVVMVNGALASTASFRQTARFLEHRYNVVLYDAPHAGQSRALNPGRRIVTKADEVRILRQLVDHTGANHILSVSWGGVAALLVLAGGPPTVRSGIVGSFAPTMNALMLDYVNRARDHVAAGRFSAAAGLLNETVGKHLPRLLKLYNHRYLAGFDPSETEQLLFNITQILELRAEDYLVSLSRVSVPVLFINGEADEYTSAGDVLAFREYVAQASFATIAGAGHFLELEGREVGDAMRDVVLRFLGQHGLAGTAAAPGSGVPGQLAPLGAVAVA